MTEVKILEVRDNGTFAPVMATKLSCNGMYDRYLLRRAGFGIPETYVILSYLNNLHRTEYSDYSWDDRTFQVAHKYIRENWESLRDGDVIDVSYILGESLVPKESERFHVKLDDDELTV